MCFCDTKTYDTTFEPHMEKIRAVYDDLNETSRPADFVFLANASQAFKASTQPLQALLRVGLSSGPVLLRVSLSSGHTNSE